MLQLVALCYLIYKINMCIMGFHLFDRGDFIMWVNADIEIEDSAIIDVVSDELPDVDGIESRLDDIEERLDNIDELIKESQVDSTHMGFSIRKLAKALKVLKSMHVRSARRNRAVRYGK